MKNYFLHDCLVNNIYFEDSKLILEFPEGIFDRTSNEFTSPCKLVFEINGLNAHKEWEHISVKQIRKTTIKEIDFAKLKKVVKKDRFYIYLDFYSEFCNGVLFICHSDFEYEIMITEVQSVSVELL